MVRPRLRLLFPLLIAACAAPQTPKPSPDAEPLVASRSAEPSFATQSELNRCDAIIASVVCPTGSDSDVFIGPRSEEGSTFCEVHCLRGAQRHGPSAVVNVSTESYEVRGAYSDGQRSGDWASWGRDPETLERRRLTEEHFLDGAHQGSYRRWSSSGQLVEEGHYMNGQKDGTWRTLGADGAWTFEGTFDQGVPVGTHRERFANGQLASQRAYDEIGRPHGQWCFWTSNGSLIECIQIERGNGPLREYDRSGRMTREFELRDGALHGRLVEYNFGLNKYEAFYEEGQLHGPERVFDGECVQREGTWSRGKLDGPYVEHSCDDPPVEVLRGQNCGGEPCGLWTRRDKSSGQIIEVSQYGNSGEMLGNVQYGSNGEIVEFWGSVGP